MGRQSWRRWAKLATSVAALGPVLAVLAYAALTNQGSGETYYSLLSVPTGATVAEIKAAYRRLALQYHPDKVRDPKQRPAAEVLFKKVAAAHEALSDVERRKLYDQELAGLNPDPVQPTKPEPPRAYPDDVRPPDEPPPLTRFEALVASGAPLRATQVAAAAAALRLLWRHLLGPCLRRWRSERVARELARQADEAAKATQAAKAAADETRRPPRPRVGMPSVRVCRFCDVEMQEGDEFLAAHLGGKRHARLVRAAGALAGDPNDVSRRMDSNAASALVLWRVCEPEQRPSVCVRSIL